MPPNTEPNSLPPLFIDAQDWRNTYNAYVEEFRNSAKAHSDAVRLEIRLKRLGYVGANLVNELKYIKDGCK